jgi:hypothetical protein
MKNLEFVCKPVEKDGVLRPKHFIEISCADVVSEMSFYKVVLMHPFLFRLRLWLGKRFLIKCVRKYRKFAANQL